MYETKSPTYPVIPYKEYNPWPALAPKDFSALPPAINNKIPRIKFEEAINILKENYNKNDLEGDLDPEAEKLLCKYVKENLNSDFVFLTNYPRKKRPMYTMPLGEEGTHSFDLLFKGIEITTGGQRIHERTSYEVYMKVI